MQPLPEIRENDIYLDDVGEKYTVGCTSFAAELGHLLRSCIYNFVSSVERRYRASRVKLNEWVIVEMEPERKGARTKQPSSNRLWMDIPDSDEE